MSFTTFGHELNSICLEANTKTRLAQNIWDVMKEPLREFARKTGERGCSIVFCGVSESDIQSVKNLAVKEGIELFYWYQGSQGHPGVENTDIGVLAWDSDWFFTQYPFKVSLNVLFVQLSADNKISVNMSLGGN